MKRKYIVFSTYLFLMIFLFFIGFQNIEEANIKPVAYGESAAEAEKKSMGIEQMLEGTECPQKPEKKGVTIERSKDLEIPEDSILENWKVYEFEGVGEFSEKRAEKMAKILLGDYFPKAEKKIEDYGDFGFYILTYRDKGINCNFKAAIKVFSEITFTHRDHQQELEEPEDGDWESVYLERDKELLQQLELGVWNGEQGYLDLAESESRQFRSVSRHVYRYKIDNKALSDAEFNFSYNTKPYNTSAFPITFEYQNGVLTEFSMYGETNYRLKKIRDANIKYNSIEEILKEAEKKIKRSALLDTAENSRTYDYYRIDGIQLYYMKYCYGDLKRKYAFVPVAEIKFTEYYYDIITKQWQEITDNTYYGLQLETGEGNWGGKW